jgi:hypothetical protein
MISGLKNIGIFLSNVHPLVYALLYLGLIPCFGIVYSAMSDEFFAPYARFEPAAAADREALATLIRTAILRSLKLPTANPRQISVDGWNLDMDSINVSSADAGRDSTIEFTATAGITRQDPKGSTVSFLQIPVSFSAKSGEIVRKPGYNRSWPNVVRPTTLRIERYLTEKQELTQKFYGEIFKSYGESAVIDQTIVLSKLETEKIDKYVSGAEGNASAVSGSCLRMFYFSAIVMTTVGFGDVLPMTPIARLLVAIQAIFGVTLVGLFLNAAAHQASMNR